MADDITTTEQASAKNGVEAIVAGVNAAPTVTEVDTHIGALSRQLARSEATIGQLVAHARELEGRALAHARDIFVRDRTALEQNQQIADLERTVADLTAVLHRLLPEKQEQETDVADVAPPS